MCLGLVLISFAAYWNSLAVPFIFDDSSAILENPTIRDLSDWKQVLSPPPDGSGVTGRPLVNLSLAINHAMGGYEVRGYHLLNLVLHATAGLFLFGCVHRTVAWAPRLKHLRRFAPTLAFAAAALWLLHPLQTESVTCVIQRTELLVGLFYLLTLYCFIRASQEPSLGWAVAAVIACAAGMASKEVMVTAPVVLFLYDRTFLAGSFTAAWQTRRRLYLGLACSWLVLLALLLSVGGTRGAAAGFGVGMTWWSYALKQSEAVILYLRLTLWPNPLVLFYGVDVVTNPLEVWPQLLLLTGSVAVSVYALVRKPVLGFCALWFFVILSPSSSVVPLVSQTVSEHRMYLPLAAPLAAVVGMLFHALPRHALGLIVAAGLALGALTVRRNHDYRTEFSIWNDTVAKVPQNARARINLGAAYNAKGDPARALEQYQIALRQDPTSPEGFNNLATLLLDAGRPAEAIEPCQTAIRLRPKFALAHNNLGTALVQTGRVAEGITHLETALQLKPNLAEAHCNLTSALVAVGRTNEAIVHGQEAVRIQPTLALAHFNLSNAYLQRNDIAPALSLLETAVRLRPNYADAHLNLGSLLYRSGDVVRAISHFREALKAKPDFLSARSNLASALFQAGQTAEAIEHYRAVIQLQPNDAETHFNLGLVLSRVGRNSEAITAHREALRLRPDDVRAKSEIERLLALVSPNSPPR